MSTFNQLMRASAASYRRSQRVNASRTREAAKQFKQQQKLEEFSNAEQAVKEYNNYINVIKSLHKEAGSSVNWEELLVAEAPSSPLRDNKNEQSARQQLNTFKPSFIDKLLGGGPKKVRRLEQQLIAAILKDDDQHKSDLEQFENDLTEHKFLQKTASGVLAKDANAYKDAIEYFEPFAEVSSLGSGMDAGFRENNITVDLRVNGTDIIPDYILSQTSTGKLSKKNMPVTKFQELYQDYVCSAVLRVGREVLQLLPVSYVVLHATGSLFDSGTGHTQESTLLSVVITPEGLAKLNFETLDPSDSMKNFHHNMKFAKSGGFSAVEKIDATTLIL